MFNLENYKHCVAPNILADTSRNPDGIEVKPYESAAHLPCDCDVCRQEREAEREEAGE